MATTSDSNFSNKTEDTPFWKLAKEGIKLLINNNPKDAQDMFAKYPENIQMMAGYSFAVFMDALMTFEEDKLLRATSVLKELEKKCTCGKGWFRTMKKAFSSSNEPEITLSESLETQIILADSQVCLAILTFLQQDISGYFKGSWALRKAWKIYEHVYTQILQLYTDIVGDHPGNAVADLGNSENESSNGTSAANSPKVTNHSVNPTNGYTKIPYSRSSILSKNTPIQHPDSSLRDCSSQSTNASSTLGFLKKSFSVNSALSRQADKDWGSLTSSLSFVYLSTTLHILSTTQKLKSVEIDKFAIERLMGAISFGYGLFQLGISLLPPSLLKLTNFLGFNGNRKNGISCLMYARNGIDMRAPLATLSLLWYHTIVRPFYALDGSNVQAGVNAASQLLAESEAEYGQSALFLFFKGRVHRLNAEISNALVSFQASVENAAQREIKILSLHEVGWCHLILLDYCSAEEIFTYLKSCSRWSRGFYSYISGICSGSCIATLNFNNIKEIKTNNINMKGNQLEEFLTRRAKCYPSEDEALSILPRIFWQLLVFEMLYLWNALPSCSAESINSIIQDCENQRKTNAHEPMIGLTPFILGCCYCIRNQPSIGMTMFRNCLELRKHLANNESDAHISAFAQYELGILLVKSTETKAEGRVLLENISQYKDYDFEQRLSVRVHSLLKHL